MELRAYQKEALCALLAYWADGGDGALIELATGTGKSLVMSELCKHLVTTYADFKIAVVAHVQELIEQNFTELINLWLAAPAGIYSAGLNRRERAQITFCGIQSIYNKAELLGRVDLLLVDEAHLIPRKSATMYGKFIAALRAINPDMRIVGLTATPYRLSTGRLDEGEDRLFDSTVYTYGIADGVRDGWLTRLVTKATETLLDVSGVQKRGGEYIESQLQAAVDKESITRRAIEEAVAYGHNRRSWLAFCSGKEHAYHVRDEIRRHGISCETILGDTPAEERKRHIANFKSGRLRGLTNNAVLTTGSNFPAADMLLGLRPSESAGLYVQIMGRLTRVMYAPGYPLDTREQRLAAIAAGPKPNALVLDFAGLIRTHGPVDAVKARTPGNGAGVAPVKECPTCHSLIPAASRECPDCGHVFEPLGVPHEPKITAKASILSIMKGQPDDPPTWLTVTGRTFALHHKPDTPTSVLTKFKCGIIAHKRWYAPARASKGHFYADRFWFEHGGDAPAPYTAEEWLERQYELRPTAEISVKPDGKYFRVDATKASDALVLAL